MEVKQHHQMQKYMQNLVDLLLLHKLAFIRSTAICDPFSRLKIYLISNQFTAHIHFQDKKQIVGTIEHWKCDAGIIIFTPINESIRKAVVIPLPKPHNHPSFKPDKFTIPAKENWRKSVLAAGALGSTVGSIEKGNIGFISKKAYSFSRAASSTSVILSSNVASRPFQCLKNSRYKSTVLGKEKRQDYPHGLQIEGMSSGFLQ